jgi:D-alanyl-D-alanine carboxypeptidase (penicillin-binding protein 5/6)
LLLVLLELMAKSSHRGDSLSVLFLVLAASMGGYYYYALHRPLLALQPTVRSAQVQAATGVSKLSWPAVGQAAVAVTGTDVLETHGVQTSAPIASTAKVITALAVLKAKPIASGSQGPVITLTAADVALYNSYVSQEGSVVSVSAGEQITEAQMLEAVMLPSANNMADSLAIWAYGSLDAYKIAATQYVAGLGLTNTHIGSDASGFSPSTTSTAHDLVILGEQAMQNPVLRQIVSQPTASDVPGLSTVKNVNFLLGTNGIIGIKTGNTDQAGGVYLSASTTKVDDHDVTIVTALVGAPTLFQALQNSVPLITSAQSNFVAAKLLAQQANVGEYRLPWGGKNGGVVSATTQTNVTSSVWRGSTASATVNLQPIALSAKAGQVVGTAVSAKTEFGPGNQTNIILQSTPTEPNIWWRLLHPF